MPRVNSLDSVSNTYRLDPLFADETEKTEQSQMYHLVELEIPSVAAVGVSRLTAPTTIGGKLKIVDANHDVVYGWTGNVATKLEYTYTRFPLRVSPAEINSDGSLAKASITIANVSREIMYYVEHYNGLRGCRVHIKTVYANALYYFFTFNPDGSVTETVNTAHNPSANLWDEYFIDTYTASDTTVAFSLDPIIDLEIRIPRRRYTVDSCYFSYRNGETCGYTGADPIVNGVSQLFCPKNLAACKLRGNQRYFGGMPGVSGSRRILL